MENDDALLRAKKWAVLINAVNALIGAPEEVQPPYSPVPEKKLKKLKTRKKRRR
jgi:hypothetical protein